MVKNSLDFHLIFEAQLIVLHVVVAAILVATSLLAPMSSAKRCGHHVSRHGAIGMGNFKSADR